MKFSTKDFTLKFPNTLLQDKNTKSNQSLLKTLILRVPWILIRKDLYTITT